MEGTGLPGLFTDAEPFGSFPRDTTVFASQGIPCGLVYQGSVKKGATGPAHMTVHLQLDNRLLQVTFRRGRRGPLLQTFAEFSEPILLVVVKICPWRRPFEEDFPLS